MTNPLLAVEWERCALEPRRDRTLEAFARRRLGIVPSFIPYLATCPWLARAEADLNARFGLLTHLDPELADLTSMVVSQINSCRYCYAASRMLMQLQGKSETDICHIEERLAEGWEEPQLEAALHFARRIGRSDPLPSWQDRQRVLDAGFSVPELNELAYVAAFTAFANRTLTLPAIPPQPMENAPHSALHRLFRPLIAFWFKRHAKPAAVTDTGPPTDAPYAYLSRPYAGTPIGSKLDRTLDEAWASRILTMRCKALLFAVVAKALGCNHSLSEAIRLLRDEGMADNDIEEALAHLQSSTLDPLEAMLVPFARETVWYKPAQIQRRARQVHAHLSEPQFLEAIGMLALANAICRLGAAIGASP